MQKQVLQNPLFSVHNHHVAACGQPPSFDGDDGRYYAYFENAYREQFVYVCDMTSGVAQLYMGDANWEQAYPVVEGVAQGVILNLVERLWLFVVDRVAHGETLQVEASLFSALVESA